MKMFTDEHAYTKGSRIRNITKFAILPINIDGQIRWMERVTIRQHLFERKVERLAYWLTSTGDKYKTIHRWENIMFLDGGCTREYEYKMYCWKCGRYLGIWQFNVLNPEVGVEVHMSRTDADIFCECGAMTIKKYE